MRLPSSLRTPTRLLTIGVVISALTLGGVALPAEAARASQGLLTDGFDRDEPAGWGESTTGESWTNSNAATSSVSSGSARVTHVPGSETTQTLSATVPQDAAAGALVWPEEITKAGNGATVSLALRSNEGASYQARVRFGVTGVNLWMSRFDGSTSKEVVLRSTKPIAQFAAGQKVRAEFSVTGTSPVVIKSRIWIDGTEKPKDWQQTYEDDSAQRIEAAGAVGVHTHLSSGSPANAVRIDDLSVSEPEASQTPTTPSPAPPAPAPTPTQAPAPAPTAAPAPAPAEPAAPAPAPAPAENAGSLAVGTASYAVPNGAVFVVPRGTRNGSGTASDPYGSAAYAVEKAPNNSTIVLRGGTYREYVYVGFNRKLTIQAYPGEAVWFDGSAPVTGWSKSGSTWIVNGWTNFFDRRISFNANADETSRFVDKNPYAGYPDQIWINDSPLRQVGSTSEVTTGTFFVDEKAKRLVIGSDPSGKRVEASTLAQAFKVQGKGTTLRGFGVQRYATTLNMMGTVTAEVDGITLENLVVRDNATVGVFTWNHDQTFNKLTITGNGMLGFGANGTRNLRVTNSVISNNNTQQFKPAPVSGGMKVSRVKSAVVADNIVADNDSAGIWFDVSSHDVRITGNRVTGSSTTGVQIEISEKAIVANNYIAGNETGLNINNSGNVKVWNNTIDGKKRAISVAHDKRRQEDPALASTIPWTLRNNSFNNNVISYGSGASCPILTQDYQTKMFGNDFGLTMNNNVYHRQSASAPSNFACWANGTAGTRSFKTLEDFSAFTGNDKNSALWMGEAVTNGDLSVKSNVLSSPRAALAGLPADVATAIGAKAGEKRIGPFTLPRK